MARAQSLRPHLAIVTLALGTALGASGCGSEAEARPAQTQEATPQAPEPSPTDATGLDYDPRQSLAPLVRSVAPAVVSIHAAGKNRGVFSAGVQASGSGFIYASDGVVITNHHVVEGARSLQVTLEDGTRHPAELLGSDAATDLAVLRIEDVRDLPTLTLGDSAALEVGDWVVAIGNPMGLDHSASVGILSGRGRGSLGLYADSYLDFLQTDADIAPGSSGGPLFDLAGNVVGITTAVGANSRPGFAIPAAQASNVVEQLLSEGRVRRGWLGAGTRKTQEGTRGAVITEVYAGTPAAEAGLRAGDIVRKVDRERVNDFDGLRAVVGTLAPGHTVLLEIEREGRPMELTAVLGSRPDADELRSLRRAPRSRTPAAPMRATPPADTDPTFGGRLGIGARAHEDGLEVVRVEAGALADDLDLQTGDVVTSVNGAGVHEASDVRDALRRSRGRVEVQFLRDGVKHDVSLERS